MPDLDPIGDPVPLDASPAYAAAVRCLDPDGDTAVVALPRYGEPGAVGVVADGEARLEAAPVVHAHAAGGTMAALLGDGTPQGQPHVIATIGDDGTVTPLAQRADTVLDRLAVSPSGRQVAAAGYPEEGGDHVVVAAVDGSTQVDRTLEGFHVLGWLDDDRLWLRDEDALAYGAAATSLSVRGPTLDDLGTVTTGPSASPMALADGGLLRLGGVVPSVLRGDQVHRVADVRLAAADHALVLDDAVLTDADSTAAAPSPTDTGTATTTTPTGDAARTPWLVALAAVVLVAAAWAARRRVGGAS